MRAMDSERSAGPLCSGKCPCPCAAAARVATDVAAGGGCRTDLHIVDVDLGQPRLPIVFDHEIVGLIRECGAGGDGLEPGVRVGVPWLGHTCGACPCCAMGAENLCAAPLYTDYTCYGGYAGRLRQVSSGLAASASTTSASSGVPKLFTMKASVV
ncbi:alcohol dehydrogenase catalytic domain-containing protein [Limibaculum sp. M0105]|uniref:Alcohol dehydrogenase catalytic domain-containing protein n=1 Tax=Thermohalobaculum xanthum TaxID=2753746 RepID=A0A8J7SDB0_9RHOB|nr:alcohol dehydrogenase catalytic domain-containing protein [Thermohalobaculum xanthum]